MKRKIKIAFVSSEAVPYVKTGGLADVLGILPKEIKNIGHDAVLVLPFYKEIKNKNLSVEQVNEYTYKRTDSQLPTYFIANNDYFDRDNLYMDEQGDYQDNALRFDYFCKKVIELFPEINFKPNIIHLNDWQTSLIPFYLKMGDNHKFYNKTKTLLTIHNMAYQGVFSSEFLPKLGLSQEVFNPFSGIEYYGKINFLKAGLISADVVSTVSEKYSQEIQEEEYGCGLDGVLRSRNDKIIGILNGADYKEWSPETDKHIAANYSLKNLGGKNECRKDLLKEFNFSATDSIPVISMISRLTDQKGFDILAACIDEILKLNLRLILLGTGERKYHEMFKKIKEKHPDHFGLRIEFNNALAHKIEAGSDMFLMPSKFEPCGLNQIYSLKYGTVPIVRATGGLDDTIENFNPSKGTGNGFKFKKYIPEALLFKVKEALNVYKNKNLWKKLIINGMKQDYSWHKSAEEYIWLYREMINKEKK